MPCFTTSVISNSQLLDLRTFISTFPSTGFPGGPDDKPPAAW
jgi:hypothetical protein